MFTIGAGGTGDEPLPAPSTPRPADGGFTLIEMIVSLMLMGVIMAASVPFLVNSLAVVARSGAQQFAVQVANDAIEQVRALRGASLLVGRGQARSTAQWIAAPSEVQPYLSPLKLAWDPSLTDPASTLGDQAPVSTGTQSITLSGNTYSRNIYIGECIQQVGSAYGACTNPDAPDPDPDSIDSPFFAVVVSVAWRHGACSSNRCVFVAWTLVSAALDPTFGLNRPPLAITSPGGLTGYRTEPVSKQLKATGGLLPLTWSASGLPAGLSISASGLVTGTPTTLGSYSVTLNAVDRVGATDNRTFTWQVLAPVQLADPGNQTAALHSAVSYSLTASGGATPYQWRATGLPAGLALDAATGVVSGTVTGGTRYVTTFYVKDAAGMQVSRTVVYAVSTADPADLRVSAPAVTAADQSSASGAATSLSVAVSGGTGPGYAWTATNLPPGLTIADSGVGGATISGTPTIKGTYLVDLVVQDTAQQPAHLMLTWTVT